MFGVGLEMNSPCVFISLSTQGSVQAGSSKAKVIM